MRLIVAGTRSQAMDYMIRAGLNRRTARYVTGPETVVGWRGQPEDVVLVGTWWAHPLWPHIQTELRRHIGAEDMARLSRDFAVAA